MRASSVSLPSIHVQAGDRAVAATYCFAHHAPWLLVFCILNWETGAGTGVLVDVQICYVQLLSKVCLQ